MPEPEEPSPFDRPWIYRAWMHLKIRFNRRVQRLLGEDTSEVDELLAENRRLRKAVKAWEKEQRRARNSDPE